jgi:8-oxo-dGTP diphosphatase
MQKNPTLVSVVAAALIAPDGRILMQQRAFSQHHGGLWEFPGGKIEPGETPRHALQREIEEELGVRLDVDALEDLANASDPVAALSIDLFAARRWQGDPQCLEGEAIGWFDWPELLALAMPPLDRPLAEALQKALQGAI